MRLAFAVAGALVCIVLSVAAVNAAEPRKGARYSGKTKQSLSMALRVARSGRAISRLSIKRETDCSGDGVRSVRVGTFKQRRVFLRVHSDGTFSGRTRIRRAAGSDIRGGRLNINGRFRARGRRVRGAFRERTRLSDGMRCDTGVVSFSLRVRGRR